MHEAQVPLNAVCKSNLSKSEESIAQYSDGRYADFIRRYDNKILDVVFRRLIIIRAAVSKIYFAIFRCGEND